jgi:lysophospholipase L1-like esterase
VTGAARLRYVALGDSFSAGVPGDDCVTWPYLLAGRLRDRGLAVDLDVVGRDGALTRDVLRDQLPAALELRPDLVTVVCGANDVLTDPSPEVERFERDLGAIAGALRERLPCALVATATYGDFSRFSPFRPRSKRRVQAGVFAINHAVRRVAAEHGCLCVEIESAPDTGLRETFADDGIHASQQGHELTAAAFDALLAPLLQDVQEKERTHA